MSMHVAAQSTTCRTAAGALSRWRQLVAPVPSRLPCKATSHRSLRRVLHTRHRCLPGAVDEAQTQETVKEVAAQLPDEAFSADSVAVVVAEPGDMLKDGKAPVDTQSATENEQRALEEKTERARKIEEAYGKVTNMMTRKAIVKTSIKSITSRGVVVFVHRLRGFMAFSRLDPARLPEDMSDQEALQKLVGQQVECYITGVDKSRRSIVLSEKQLMLDRALKTMHPGDLVTGRINRITDFGAFAVLKEADGKFHCVEGLIHKSEMSWDRVMTPDSVVKVGEVVKLMVKRIDREELQLELSLKRVKEDPLQETLDNVLERNSSGETSSVPTELPQGVEHMIQELQKEEGINEIQLGRQAEERAVSQDLELWISKEAVEDGYNLVARAGRIVQEIHVVTDLPAEAMKEAVQAVLARVI